MGPSRVTIPKEKNKKEKQKKAKKDQENRMTMLLVAILITYVICTIPNTAVNIWYYAGNVEVNYAKMAANGFNIRLITAPCNLLLTCNYSLNFYLYCFANR